MKRAFATIAPTILIIAVAVLFLPLSSGAQGEGEEAVVASHNSFIEPTHFTDEDQRDYEGDFLHIIGVVQVTGAKNIKDVGVEVTFYDSGGERIVAGPVHSMLGFSRLEDGVQVEYGLLGPGDRLPFDVVLLDEAASAKVASYKISVKYEVTEQEPYTKLAVLSHRLWSSGKRMRVIGELANTGEQYVGDVSVHVAFYDPAGRIVGAEYYPAPMFILIPGEKIAFATYPAQIEGDITYELMPICIVEDLVPYREFKILSHSTHMDEYGDLILEGEVANIGDRDAANVVVAADFYDREGNPLGGYYADATGEHRIPEIKAGKSSPFRIEFWENDLAPQVANYTFHVSSGPYTSLKAAPIESGAAVAPEPGPAAVAAGAFVSATIVSSQAAGEAGQLTWRKALEALQGKRAEADFEVEKEARRRIRKSRKRELGSLAAAIFVVASALAYAYAEPRGLLPNITETVGNMFAAPALLFEATVASSAVLLVCYLVRLGVANRLKATVEYNLWPVGILMLFVSALLKSPFGAPGEVRTEATSHRVKAEIALSVILASLATSGLFYLLLKMGFPTEMGVYYGLTLGVASAVPVKPLAGYSIRLYDKKLSAALLIVCFYLFFVHLLEGSDISGQTWFFLSIVAAILLVAVAAMSVSSTVSQRRRKRAMPPPTAVPAPGARVAATPDSIALGPTTPAQERVLPTSVKYCIECGELIPEVAVYCPRCASKQE